MHKHCKTILKKISEMCLFDKQYKIHLIFKTISKVSVSKKRFFNDQKKKTKKSGNNLSLKF